MRSNLCKYLQTGDWYLFWAPKEVLTNAIFCCCVERPEKTEEEKATPFRQLTTRAEGWSLKGNFRPALSTLECRGHLFSCSLFGLSFRSLHWFCPQVEVEGRSRGALTRREIPAHLEAVFSILLTALRTCSSLLAPFVLVRLRHTT